MICWLVWLSPSKPMYFLANFQFVSMTPMLEKILNTVGQNLHTNLGAYNYDCLLSAKINGCIFFKKNGLSIIEMYNSPKGGGAHCLGCTIQKSYQCLYSILWLVKIFPVFSMWANIPSFSNNVIKIFSLSLHIGISTPFSSMKSWMQMMLIYLSS